MPLKLYNLYIQLYTSIGEHSKHLEKRSCAYGPLQSSCCVSFSDSHRQPRRRDWSRLSTVLPSPPLALAYTSYALRWKTSASHEEVSPEAGNLGRFLVHLFGAFFFQCLCLFFVCASAHVSLLHAFKKNCSLFEVYALSFLSFCYELSRTMPVLRACSPTCILN